MTPWRSKCVCGMSLPPSKTSARAKAGPTPGIPSLDSQQPANGILRPGISSAAILGHPDPRTVLQAVVTILEATRSSNVALPPAASPQLHRRVSHAARGHTEPPDLPGHSQPNSLSPSPTESAGIFAARPPCAPMNLLSPRPPPAPLPRP